MKTKNDKNKKVEGRRKLYLRLPFTICRLPFIALLITFYFSIFITPPLLHCEDICKIYNNAMEAFYKKDYKAAILLWEKILQLDPNQKNPKKLIEMARAKILESAKTLNIEYNQFIDEGDYQKALSKLGQILETDPTNPTWLAQKEKLEKFIADVAPSITGTGKVPELLRKSVSGYLGREKDERIPVIASRYAWQLSKADKIVEKNFIFMDKEFSLISRLDVMDRIKTVIEQKLDTALEAIYDGKYELAGVECELVLVLEPDNVVAYKRLGSACYAQGKLKQAKTAWEKALKLSPTDPELKRFLQKIR